MVFILALHPLRKDSTILIDLRIVYDVNIRPHLDKSFILCKLCLKATEPQIIRVIEENTKT